MSRNFLASSRFASESPRAPAPAPPVSRWRSNSSNQHRPGGGPSTHPPRRAGPCRRGNSRTAISRDRSCRLDPSVRRHRVSADQAGTRGYGGGGSSGEWQVARLRPCPMSSVRDILKAALCPSTAHSRTSSASVRASGQQLLLAAPQPALPPPHSGCDPNAQSPCSADGAGLRRHAFSTRYTRNSTRDREAWRPCPTNSV